MKIHKATAVILKRQCIIILCILCALLTPICATQANNTDKALWTSFELSKKINKRIKIIGEFELRTNDYIKDIGRISAGINLQYKITYWLNANAGYTFIANNNSAKVKYKYDTPFFLYEKEADDTYKEYGELYNYNHTDSYWKNRSRGFLSLSGKIKFGRFTLTLRERLQYTYTHHKLVEKKKYRYQYINALEPSLGYEQKVKNNIDEKGKKHYLALRSRFTTKYDIPKCKITPFVSAELFSRIREWDNEMKQHSQISGKPTVEFFDKLRTQIGIDYKLNKKNYIKFYYLFENEKESDKTDTHALGIEYKLEI